MDARMQMMKGKLPSPLQLVFLLDTTGSMRGEIIKCKANLTTIVAAIRETMLGKLENKCGGSKIDLQIAFIPYKDISTQGVPDPGHLEGFHDFSKDTKSITASIEKCKPTGGGGDGPEDLRGGLDKALDALSWSQARNAVKIICVLTDAPCHGKEFYDKKGQRDNHRLDGPNMMKTLQRLIDNKVTLLLSAVDKPVTAKMSSEFRNFYQANKRGQRCTYSEFDLDRGLDDQGFQQNIIEALRGVFMELLDDDVKVMLKNLSKAGLAHAQGMPGPGPAVVKKVRKVRPELVRRTTQDYVLYLLVAAVLGLMCALSFRNVMKQSKT